ncbi:MAG: NADH-quinone oxidoreductase subunit NuoE [Dethiobacter sp.]|jgi:NADH-quinone oxidoreductase subunit E|nr:NADH-quinone oxidoreductase subunit NuoE [Dethiobacter sp.]MCL4464398.1 NADH-quinone oxidoreductase subunit NuoE [Bacillota bacterium]MBS3900313.1 NADH-quinone oxidoreductase subunit NuoE [Dethiobacter sp.]MBS3982372.1 NADH-quinone oxidoreductase subunit NuoE [Dethiobacter sp.]MCL4464399.1 NADH-quinone oxidoreductase subunit NuoE [Bacillota bacterium]
MQTAPEAPEQQIAHIFSRFKGERKELIPLLQTVQEIFGYLPEEALKEVARFTSVSESQVYSTATFYAQFHFKRRGKHNIKVCCGTACHVRGATPLLEAFERELGIECGTTTNDFEYNLERVACVGSCALAPVVMVDDTVFGLMETKRVSECLVPKGVDNK